MFVVDSYPLALAFLLQERRNRSFDGRALGIRTVVSRRSLACSLRTKDSWRRLGSGGGVEVGVRRGGDGDGDGGSSALPWILKVMEKKTATVVPSLSPAPSPCAQGCGCTGPVPTRASCFAGASFGPCSYECRSEPETVFWPGAPCLRSWKSRTKEVRPFRGRRWVSRLRTGRTWSGSVCCWQWIRSTG